MNIYQFEILKHIHYNSFTSQRALSSQLGISLGKVNACLAELVLDGFLSEENAMTPAGEAFLASCHPKQAIILAAGYGLRMVPINTEIPKALIEINGEPLIERLIRQLREVGVEQIYVVVGYQKEKFEYLIDAYQVELIVNMDYSTKNNLHSLDKAKKYIDKTYILPCDMWCRSNPFCEYEPYTWYMVQDRMSTNSSVRINRQKELVAAGKNTPGNSMIGISYISSEDAPLLRERLTLLANDPAHQNSFWDDALFSLGRSVYAHLVSTEEVIEINTVEQLRDIDHESEQLHSSALSIIADVFHTDIDAISHIETLKKGMTNRSFLFTVASKRYIMRIPGEGTDKLINRREEAAVYQVLDGQAISDDVLYMNPDNGYKITRYLEGIRNCDPENETDLRLCMAKLYDFHQRKLRVDHTFDLFGQISYYESLWEGKPSMYRDYETTREHVFSLKSYIDAQPKDWVLTHIDAVPDNFLIPHESASISLHASSQDAVSVASTAAPSQDAVSAALTAASGDSQKCTQDIRLIDWEYAGMQDPHVDLAMFCIYALYRREQVDHLIDLYFANTPQGTCSHEVRIKIYCYIAVCGLLWSNWCEYKAQLGIEFGEYALRQYRYAKDYYHLVKEEI